MVRLLAALLLAIGLSVPAFAETDTESILDSSSAQLYEEQLRASGADELYGSLSEDTQSLLRSLGITDLSFGSLLRLTPAACWEVLTHQLGLILARPLRTLLLLTGFLLLGSLVASMEMGSRSLSAMMQGILGIGIALTAAIPILTCVEQAASAIHASSDYILTSLPVMTTVMVAGGQPVTAGTGQLVMMAACQLCSAVASTFLLPLVGIHLALSLTGSCTPSLDLSATAGCVKSVASWTLGILVTAFVALLTLQGLIAQSADTVALKTGKFLVGSLVPVVGSALSDALASVQGCVRLLKTSIGVFGIFAVALTILPVFLKVVAWKLVMTAACALAGFFQSPTQRLFAAIGEAIGLLISMLLCFGLLLIVSTTLLLMVGIGV